MELSINQSTANEFNFQPQKAAAAAAQVIAKQPN